MTDLTRWNRAGLSHVDYVDGNAATYLEQLRRDLSRAFPQWQSLEVPASEPASVRERRLVDQYQAPRRDWGFELARVLARSCHVITTYIEAYANEGYLPTATQWESVRRLVAMLDYHPAPPASASTFLAIETPPATAGSLERGFQVQHVPPDGGPPVVFETLEALAVDAQLNGLRPAGRGRDPRPLAGTTLTLEEPVSGLRAGEPVVLEDLAGERLAPFLLTGVAERADGTEITISPPVAGFVAGDTLVHLKPVDRLDVVGPPSKGTGSLGPTVVLRDVPSDLEAGAVAYLSDGTAAYYRWVTGVQGRRLKLAEPTGSISLTAGRVGLPLEVPIVESAAEGKEILLAGDWRRLKGTAVAVEADGRVEERAVKEATFTEPAQRAADRGGHTRLTLTRALPLQASTLLVAPPALPWPVDTILERVQSALPSTVWTSKPLRAAAGDVLVLARGGQAAGARVAAVSLERDGSEAHIAVETPWSETGGGPYFLADTTAYTHFVARIRVAGWDRNRAELAGRSVTLDSIPATLVPGRAVVLSRSDAPDSAVVARVRAVRDKVVELDREVPDGSRVDTLVIEANVVAAGHGTAVDEQVLGSGDATQAGQSFVIEGRRLSFVADPTQRSGVRADLEVRIDGRRWEQVPGFAGSRPDDAHYTVRMTEDGEVRVVFGDGREGRRLPTGVDNVRARYRVGAGLSGNLPSASVTEPVRPHALVASARQPVAAAGGNDLEPVESLRRNAPAALLTLDRAVALADYGHLAMTQSSVWEARAAAGDPGRGRSESVVVTVVPAGGGDLGEQLRTQIEDFLGRHGVPGVKVEVTGHRLLPLRIDAAVRVNPDAFDPELVARDVRAALVAAFTLPARRLGQSLHRSDVFEVVESVRGVEDSTCTIAVGDGAPERKLTAAPDAVIALRRGDPPPTVTTQEFAL